MDDLIKEPAESGEFVDALRLFDEMMQRTITQQSLVADNEGDLPRSVAATHQELWEREMAELHRRIIAARRRRERQDENG
jgi:hypothetical protein